ncbi:MAG: DNA polymerase/3'-5' exonuclease PolX [Myxococcales bacterium]
MTPRDVAAVLREISQLLQLKGESSFKVRAYDLGAEVFEALPPDPAAPGGLLERVKAGTLSELSGVGKAIDQKVTELVTTGQLRYLNELRAEFPPGALTLVRIPGLGPRKAAALIRELDVGSLADLEKACLEHRVRGLKGFGEKTEAQILEGVQAMRTEDRRWALGETRRFAESLLARVREAPGIARAEIAGSVRRYAETNGDVDLVAALAEGAQPAPAMEAFRTAPGVESVIGSGSTKCSVRLRDGVQADLRVVTLSQFATALHHFTGGKNHHVKLRGLARDKGLTLSEYALARIDPARGPALEVRDEAELYRHLGLAEIPPELREDRGEIEAAARGELPALVARSDIQGFVHCHTTWSDGRHTTEEMVRAAKALGAKFITISDHTQAAHYAGGLTPERLKRQWDELAAVEERVGGIRVLRGSEVDILEDGRLDLPDAVLEQLDVVICSMHTRFRLDEDAQTERIRRALSHPLCRIWGHPTGRKVLDRPAAAMRMEELFAVAAEKGVTVEANGTPDRLDLSADLLLLARKHGCKVSDGVDAHHIDELDRNLGFAVGTARRGWTERTRVVNARGPDQFLAALKAPTGAIAP